MKTIKLTFLFSLLFLVASCDRSGIFEEFQQAIPWEFHVVVYSDDNMTQTVADATINIYKNQADRDNNINVFLTKKSDKNGEAVFLLKDFEPSSDPQKAKGFYYLKVQKDGIIKNDITRYLLMNDGHTYHYIILKAN